MVDVIKHLSTQVPIVRSDGTPTPYFAGLLESISDAKISASVIAAMGGDPAANMAVVWDDAVGNLVFLSLSDMLDWIDDTHGSILFRGAAGWETLPPGTSGYYLKTLGSGADPEWATVSASGTGEAELTPPVYGNFTYQGNAGGAMVSVANGVRINAPNIGSTYNARAVCTTGGPASFADFTVVARLKRTIPQVTSGGGANQLFIRNSSNGRMILFGDTLNGTGLAWQRWQNDTTFNANIWSATLQEGGAHAFPWRRIKVTSSTAVLSASMDGFNWESMGSTNEPYGSYLTAAGGSADQVGFSSHTVNNAWNYSNCTSWAIS